MSFNFQDFTNNFSNLVRSAIKRNDTTPKSAEKMQKTRTSSNADTPQTSSKLSQMILNIKQWIGKKTGKHYSKMSTDTTRKDPEDEPASSSSVAHENWVAETTKHVGTNILRPSSKYTPPSEYQVPEQSHDRNLPNLEDWMDKMERGSSVDTVKAEETSEKREAALQKTEERKQASESRSTRPETLSDKAKTTNAFILKNQSLFPTMLDERGGEKQKVKIQPLESGLQQKLVLFRGKDDNKIYLKIGSQKTKVGSGSFKEVYGEKDLVFNSGEKTSQVELVRTVEQPKPDDKATPEATLLGMKTEQYVQLHPELVGNPYVATAIRSIIVTIELSGSATPPKTEYKMITHQEKADGNLSEIPKTDHATYLQCIEDAAEGLAKLHELGIIHADVKDQNILFYKEDEKTSAKISDFGTATITNQPDNPDVRKTYSSEGSLFYLSPEALECVRADQLGLKDQATELGKQVTTPTDVWGLGATLYMRMRTTILNESEELFQPPWLLRSDFGPTINPYGLDDLQASLKNPNAKLKLSDADKELLKLVADMLKMNPNERPTMREVADRLKEINKGILRKYT